MFYAGDSPAIVKLPRKHSYTVTVQAGGYASQTLVITREFNAWFVGNILFGGIPGGIVDAITGAMWNLEPSSSDGDPGARIGAGQTGPGGGVHLAG